MKLKFAGFVRGILGHRDASPARPVAGQNPPPAAAPLPARSQPASVPFDAENSIQLPLAPIVSMLPIDLKAKLTAFPQPGQTITLAVDTVVSQLAFGAVKITFGELRQMCPGVIANGTGEHDSRQISLPLQEILARINPALLARRSTQKVEVAEEVAGPFDGRGRGVTFTKQPMRPVAPPTPAAPAPTQPIAFAPPAGTPPAGRSVKPESNTETFTFTPRQITPSAPIAFTPIAPAKPNPTLPPASGPGHANGNGSGANGNGNGNGIVNHGNGAANGNGANSLPPFKFSTTTNTPVQPTLPRPQPTPAPRPALAPTPIRPAAPAPAPVPAAAAQARLPVAPAPAPAPLTGSITLTLDDLSEAWPEEIKNEIMGPGLRNAGVVLPLALIEPGLKRGRITMTWKELRILAKPSSAPSPNDNLNLDLPLKVLAPAFIASQKNTKRQAKVTVAEEIPNLFFGFPQASPASQQAAQSLHEALMPPPQELPKSEDTNFFPASPQTEHYTRPAATPGTDFTSRMMHPKDVVARAISLPGVAGAVVTLADGLRVASEIPADMSADAVSAFLPQIYERVNQSTRELRMGPLNNVGFTVGSVAWKIYRINSIYFAAFGYPGQAIPKAQLAALASELDRKRQ